MTPSFLEFDSATASATLRRPLPSDDKYSRGVLGVATGSDRYPGAAVLGVEAAVRSGIGMVRYLGELVPSTLVLQRRPEVVTADGRVQAWLLGSGTDAAVRSREQERALVERLESGVAIVLDAGALDLIDHAAGPTLITPHFRELARLLSTGGPTVEAATVAADPARWAVEAAERWGVAVLLKGSATHVVGGSTALVVSGSTPWLATAGSGDVLGGIAGAVAASIAADGEPSLDDLARVGATAAHVHARAGALASDGGPIAALDIAERLPRVVAALLAAGSPASR